MKLGDLRKLAIRKQVRIRFPLQNGMECVITERGVAQVPALKGIPDFNLEQELASAQSFQLDPVSAPGQKAPVQTQAAGREQLAAMVSAGPAAAIEHEEE